jgi:hypothetical protein
VVNRGRGLVCQCYGACLGLCWPDILPGPTATTSKAETQRARVTARVTGCIIRQTEQEGRIRGECLRYLVQLWRDSELETWGLQIVEHPHGHEVSLLFSPLEMMAR